MHELHKDMSKYIYTTLKAILQLYTLQVTQPILLANVQGRCKKGERICSTHIYINCAANPLLTSALLSFCMKSQSHSVRTHSYFLDTIIWVLRAFVLGLMVKVI